MTAPESKAKPKTEKATAAPAPIVPVSVAANIEVEIFSHPQKNMRGFAIASDTVNGKFVRYAHAYLWTDLPAELTLDSIRRKMSAADLERITEILKLFVEKLQEADASR